MPMHSAPGPDSWNSIFIKKCKVLVTQALSIAWRKSSDTGEIPDALKIADIAPLHMGGSKALAKNYRSVALTSHLIKAFEGEIRSHVTSFMDNNDLHNPGQHGFRAGRAYLSQLLDHYDKVTEALEEK
ncbi:uncharacterized protein [Procambarus clarkii]|uniref:uncharacterized protein n=1 Tax=Procambarus clarkii TaxID=6728 RepID=UPI0037444EB5